MSLGEYKMIYIVLGYLGTIIVSLSVRGVNKFLFIKDLASHFYKVDIDSLNDESDDIEYFNFKKIDYKSFIPGYNLVKSIACLIKYCQDYDDICDELEDKGIIYTMANFEIYEYRKNPSIINLFKVLKRGRERLMEANYFEAMNDKGEVEAQVFYEGNEDINILDTMGKFESMLTSEVKEVIKTNDEKGMFDNFIHDDGKNIVTARSTKNEKSVVDVQNLSIRERIIKLEELERELLICTKEEKGKQKRIGIKR